VHAQLRNGESTIHLASRHGHIEIVGMLLGFGLAPDAPSAEGTPLHLACAGGHRDVVQLLHTWGADIRLRSRLRFAADTLTWSRTCVPTV